MPSLRERAVVVICAWAIKAACWIAPRPEFPNRLHWTVSLPDPDYTCEVWFVSGTMAAGGHHVICWLDFGNDVAMLVDSGAGRSWIQPMVAHARSRVRSFVRPEFVVEVQANSKTQVPYSSVGPVTCIHLAKRVIGIHKPWVVTSRQLLDELWRLRDGR